MSKYKLTIFNWQNGIWGNRNYYFNNIEEAKNKLKREKGKSKIYNSKNQVVYSEHNLNNDYSNNN